MTLVDELLLRVLLAALLGGFIGLEREYNARVAGLRTHLLVCIGACMFTVTSIYMTATLGAGDPARLPSQVVSGIGFIGAGAVWKTGASVSGLTTAASLWAVAAVGLACGVGFFDGALVLTVLVLITLLILGHLEHHAKTKGNDDE